MLKGLFLQLLQKVGVELAPLLLEFIKQLLSKTAGVGATTDADVLAQDNEPAVQLLRDEGCGEDVIEDTKIVCAGLDALGG